MSWATFIKVHLGELVAADFFTVAGMPPLGGFALFKHRISNASAEGLNSKIRIVKEMDCGFRNRDHYKTAIYFRCGGLDMYPRLETGKA